MVEVLLRWRIVDENENKVSTLKLKNAYTKVIFLKFFSKENTGLLIN